MLTSRGSGFDAGWLNTYFPFFSNLAEKNLLIVKNFLSIAKMASLVYERENWCAKAPKVQICPKTFVHDGSFPV